MSRKTKTTATKEEATPALVPKLRFPEFRAAAGWEGGQLESALSSISSGLVLEQSSDTSGFKVTRIETISAGTIDLEKVGLVKTSQDISAYKLRVGDILLSNINSVAHIGKSVFLDRDYDLYHGMNLLRLAVNRTKHEPQFIYYLINTDGIRASLRERANKAVNQASINQTELGKTAVALPLKLEQQKIAECLSSVDELIAAQARKVDALKTHKKGLMQQLFPREGETQPRLRFPEFQNAGEWEEDTLDDIATFRRGSFPQPYGLPEWYDEKNGIPFIQVFDVADSFRLKDKTKSKISKLGAEKSVFIPEGTLIVTLQGSIGRVAITHYDAYIDRTLLIFESFQKPIEIVFFSRVIQNLFDIEKEKAPGGIIKTITKDSLSDFKVKYPKVEEQQRIASCLTSLDDLIAAQTQKHEALKTHKKGLMQQLFPSPEEVEA